MLTDNTANLKPATPRRTTPIQALSGLFRTPTRLRTPTAVSRRNKRARPRTSSLSSSTPSTPNAPSLPAVVLQTYSVSTDSIVLTALSSVPFCCHEDLLTMSRAQLEAVIRALNARLPRRMRICPENDFWQNDDKGGGVAEERDDDDDEGVSRMSEAEMRRCVEELVGIRAVVGRNRVSRSGWGAGTRAGVPPAPKATRTRDAGWRPYEKTPWEMDVDDGGDPTDDLGVMIDDALMGSSPLAARTKSGHHVRGWDDAVPRLAILREENEGGESKEDGDDSNETRPSKRQRVALGGVAGGAEGVSHVVREVRESRLIENMDVSGSPLLARDDDDAFPSNFTGPDEGMVTISANLVSVAKTSVDEVQAPLQRRRSARIKDMALKRMSSSGATRKTASDVKSASILRSNTFTSRRSPRNMSTSLGEPDAEKDSGEPRELTIRLPFAPTPPQQKPDSSAWSAPHVLRSHSQRFVKSGQMKPSLGRSQSERYPRASDLAFVTIDRPRYRFAPRKSKGTKVVKENQALGPSASASRSPDACHPQECDQIGTELSDGKHEHEMENEDPMIATRNSAMGNLHTLPSALCSLFTTRSRAPSTSTVASARCNGTDSPAPAPAIAREGAVLTVVTESVVSDGITEHVWEALERMAVDSV